MNVEVAVLSSPSLTVLMVSVDVKQHWTWPESEPSLIVLIVSVDGKQH